MVLSNIFVDIMRKCLLNKPFNENASKQHWHGLANCARPLTERYVFLQINRDFKKELN